MYLDFKVKIPSDSAGITRKKSKEPHTFITHMSIITVRKKDIRFPRAHQLVSVQMMNRI